ncbi:MAG: DUF6527 family protein [Candidatus Sulfotelmatobacter sp.]
MTQQRSRRDVRSATRWHVVSSRNLAMKLTYRDVRYSEIVRARDQTEAKQQLKDGVLVLVIPNKRPKSLKFLCPCGCGETVSVNLLRGKEKAWRLDYDPNHGVSLWPSVWLTSGCCSHFILRHNRARLIVGKMPKMSATEWNGWW